MDLVFCKIFVIAVKLTEKEPVKDKEVKGTLYELLCVICI